MVYGVKILCMSVPNKQTNKQTKKERERDRQKERKKERKKNKLTNEQTNKTKQNHINKYELLYSVKEQEQTFVDNFLEYACVRRQRIQDF